MKKIVCFIFPFISLTAAAQKKQTDLQEISRKDKTDGSNYYFSQDFALVKKIDVHTHILTAQQVAQQALDDNFILISVNTEAQDILPPIDSQQHYVLQLRKNFPKNIYYVTTFETATINQPGWSDRQLAWLKRSFDSGAIGVKVWKNIGMVIKDKDSNFIMIDNPVFDPIFNYLEKNHIPVIGHLGEPKNCWFPLDQMTTSEDRRYFKKFPQYHMYLHPEYPSYEAQIQARDHLLEKHPNLKFLGAHLASLEWDVDEIAKRLDKFPNLSVETAARIPHLILQSKKDREKVRNFFIKYRDRIMYGSDLMERTSANADTFKISVHNRWVSSWKYFATDDSLGSAQDKFQGLKLPKTVIDKIYYKNAEKWYFSKSDMGNIKSFRNGSSQQKSRKEKRSNVISNL